MVVGLTDPMIENFQNADEDDQQVIEYFDDGKTKYMCGYEDEDDIIYGKANPKTNKATDNNPLLRKFKENVDSNNVDSEDDREFDREVDSEDDNVVEEEAEQFKNTSQAELIARLKRRSEKEPEVSVIEGFNGSVLNDIINERLLLKSILFGLLFYLLANPKSFEYTKSLTSNLDKLLVHTILFTLIVYFIGNVV